MVGRGPDGGELRRTERDKRWPGLGQGLRLRKEGYGEWGDQPGRRTRPSHLGCPSVQKSQASPHPLPVPHPQQEALWAWELGPGPSTLGTGVNRASSRDSGPPPGGVRTDEVMQVKG